MIDEVSKGCEIHILTHRCQDPTELGTFFSAQVCPKCTSYELVLPSNPLVSTSSWACTKCKHQVCTKY